MARLDMGMQIGMKWEFECWSPMLVETPIGLDITVKCPITGVVEFKLEAAPGDVFEVGKKDFEDYLAAFPVEVIVDSRLKWKDGFGNLVVTVGRNEILDTFLNNAAPSAGLTWYVGLKDTGSVVAADTMASHAGWAELDVYSEGTRPGFTGGTVASGSLDNSGAKAAFSITSTDDVYGGFLVNENTKSGGLGILYGGGDFGAPRSVQNGDTLNVTVTAALTSS